MQKKGEFSISVQPFFNFFIENSDVQPEIVKQTGHTFSIILIKHSFLSILDNIKKKIIIFILKLYF